MKAMQLAGAALLGCAAARAGARATGVMDAHVAEMRAVAEADPADVSTRMRLAGYLQSVGLVEEGNAILKELAAEGADVHLLVDAERLEDCPECQVRSVGGDIIVGDLNGIANHGKVQDADGEWINAFSIGRTSCNIGDEPLDWIANNNRHAVFAGALYRVHDGALRQLGQSWLKHSFFALSLNLCSGGGCQGGNGSVLGVNCSDPYTASRAGQQSNNGPKHQVRASAGTFPYPPASGAGVADLSSRRIRVRLSDLDPAIWPGAVYIGDEAHIHHQDAQAENNDNNNSWERLNFTYNNGGTPEDRSDDLIVGASFQNPTRRMQTPIDAWREFVPGVQAQSVHVPNDCNIGLDGLPGPTHWSGRFHVGDHVVDHGDGTWTYRYAIFNQNSDRSARAFTIAVSPGVEVTSPGFADVDYHSGDGEGNVNFDGADWAFERGGASVSWSTQAFGQNQNANAIRWGTTYTFSFTADGPPTDSIAVIGLFKPGPDADRVLTVRGPACVLEGNLDGDTDVDFHDLNLLLEGFNDEYTFADLNALLSNYNVSCW